VGGTALSEALLRARLDLTPQALNASWLRHSHAGDAAAEAWQVHPPESEPLRLRAMATPCQAMHAASGGDSRSISGHSLSGS